MNGSVTNNNDKYVLTITDGVSEELNLTITIIDLAESDFAHYSLDVTNSIDTTEVNFTVTAESKFNFFISFFILRTNPIPKGLLRLSFRNKLIFELIYLNLLSALLDMFVRIVNFRKSEKVYFQIVFFQMNSFDKL